MQFDADALVKTEKPLDDAAKFIHHLHLLGSKHITAYNLGFEVYLRKVRLGFFLIGKVVAVVRDLFSPTSLLP